MQEERLQQQIQRTRVAKSAQRNNLVGINAFLKRVARDEPKRELLENYYEWVFGVFSPGQHD